MISQVRKVGVKVVPVEIPGDGDKIYLKRSIVIADPLKGGFLMNRENLHMLFDKYIENMQNIDEQQQEYYKWIAAEQFSKFDFNGPDFGIRLRQLYSNAQKNKCIDWTNLLDSQWVLPFTALIKYANDYGMEERVRNSFLNLFGENGDQSPTMTRIRSFIEETEAMRHEAGLSDMFVNNTRSAMQFLALRDPEHYYFIKNAQSRTFADSVDFFEPWGTYDKLLLGTYVKFMDQLVTEIKNYPRLVDAQNDRLARIQELHHADPNYHILAFDIIYCSTKFNYYDGLVVLKDSKAKKEYRQKQMTAQNLQDNLETIRGKYEALSNAQEYLQKVIRASDYVIHKMYGKGKMQDVVEDKITAEFSSGIKTISVEQAVKSGVIRFDYPGYDQEIEQYKKVLGTGRQITEDFKSAQKRIEPYLDYIN